MDAYKQELNRLVEGKEKLRQAIIGKGVNVPASVKIEDYPEYIRQIKEKPPVPTGPATTLTILKMQMDAGIAQNETPIGTEIADTWNNTTAPLIVGTYRQVTTSDGKSVFAVGLVRKYSTSLIEKLSRYGYVGSNAQKYIEGAYFEKCSDEAKEVVASVNIPIKDESASSTSYMPAKFFAFSRSELRGSNTAFPHEGDQWEYWKSRTNLIYATSASSSTISGLSWALRSGKSLSGYNYYVDMAGNIGSAGGGIIGLEQMPTVAYVVGCYIIKEEK